MNGAYGQHGVYGALGGDAAGPPYKQLRYPYEGKTGGRKRMNIVAICLCLFVPWLVFLLVFAMLSFHMHYSSPDMCHTVCIIVGIVLALVCVLAVFDVLRRLLLDEPGRGESTVLLFLGVSSLVGFVLAIAVGNRNFWINMQPYYDLTSLNSYRAVEVSRMRGQELMDAGRVKFVPGTHLDLRKSMGFRNQDTYCVAPITGGLVQGDPPLASYDFWAIGLNCCSGDAADFKCGAYNNPTARGGVRLMRDEERAFFRLAVQQAQSAYAIKSIHPLFFYWVEDPVAETDSYRQEGFKYYLFGMFAHFGFQLLLVAIAVPCFAGMISL